MAITGQIRNPLKAGEIVVAEWQKAGLLKSSLIKPIFTTVEKRLILQSLGKLQNGDQQNLKSILQKLLG